jgi:hypothetical protein
MAKIKPTINWLRKALLMSILTHPLVREPGIYYPGTTDELITIDRGRLFGGAELIESGLTLSVHPFHSAFDVLKGTMPRGNCTIEYSLPRSKRDTLSEGDEHERGHSACIKLVVQLFYRDPGLNVPITLSAEVMEARGTRPRHYHGADIRFYEDSAIQDMFPNKGEMPYRFDIEVQTLPGEEILTQWLDLLKDAIRDIKYMHPFTQYRNPTIVKSDYPTTTWLAKSGNLVFHTAYHVVEFNVSEPPRTYEYDAIPINKVFVVDNLAPV